MQHVEKCVFLNNTAQIAGGIHILNVSTNITDCVFSENSALGAVGGGASFNCQVQDSAP